MSRITKSIALTPEQDEFVDGLVASGDYQSASEVVREGLRLLGHEKKRQQAELDEIRWGIRSGLADLAEGRFTEGTAEEVIGAVFDEALERRGE
ncbi:MAG: antitoxin ParD1/3/4 [Gammaproteobacteria bacterium]|jgi:antitoxin ParD1/3/4